MNPFYNRPGNASRVEAFKRLVRMTRRWGSNWYLYQDIIDQDYLVVGSSAQRALAEHWPGRYQQIAESYEQGSNVRVRLGAK